MPLDTITDLAKNLLPEAFHLDRAGFLKRQSDSIQTLLLSNFISKKLGVNNEARDSHHHPPCFVCLLACHLSPNKKNPQAKCPRTNQAPFCIGDSVITRFQKSKGQVVAINSYNGKPTYKDSYSDFEAHPADLYLTSGCSKDFKKQICVGNSVISYSSEGWRREKVVGVNPINSRFALESEIRREITVDQYYGNLAIVAGCWKGVCIGDRFVTANARGSIAAFQFHQGESQNLSNGKFYYSEDNQKIYPLNETYGFEITEHVANYPAGNEQRGLLPSELQSLARPTYKEKFELMKAIWNAGGFAKKYSAREINTGVSGDMIAEITQVKCERNGQKTSCQFYANQLHEWHLQRELHPVSISGPRAKTLLDNILRVGLIGRKDGATIDYQVDFGNISCVQNVNTLSDDSQMTEREILETTNCFTSVPLNDKESWIRLRAK